jgi:adenylosuccinate synthase
MKKLELMYFCNLLVSRRSHLYLPTHRLLDAVYESRPKEQLKLGSTLKGIGPLILTKLLENGIRIGDLTSPHFYQKYHDLKNKHLQMPKVFYRYSDDSN